MKGRVALVLAVSMYAVFDDLMCPHSLSTAFLSGALLGALVGAAELGVFKA